ncbi:hypothetical protein H310_12713 [Aphanomyces invadans]|uniref:Uncharacterized protein n=1 Tax=Aphanomyces invadans TaxID=157072 RepID=A0A024TGK1_9STRA|nr:hypothetical protein H310_12713 [Aphanomyces invadans]ETV93285.1 hypothetical protein H310_12713 [Aphanomyces invadans]|eukprot:XP_008878120.1 hypothetical protein H310_12713 [Aphanomyces invadans]
MKRPEGQEELEQTAARGMLEGALQMLGSLEAVEQLLCERREEEAVRTVNNSVGAKRKLLGAETTTWKFEEPAKMVPRVLWWTLKDLDFERVRMEEVQLVDDLSETFGMDGVCEATFDFVSDATSDVNAVDEGNESGILARVFEDDAYLAEFWRTKMTSKVTSCGC